PLSGMMGSYGEGFKHGIEFVIDQMEAEGALDGAEIEVVWADDGGDPQQSTTEMTRLCTVENVCAVLGPWATDCGNAACPLADTYQIPNIGLHVGGEVLSTLNLEYWRTILPEGIPGDYGRSMVDFIKYCIDNYDLPHDRIVVAATDDTTGATQRASILERLEEYGLADNIVFDLQYNPTAASMDQYALQCKAEDPDIMIAMSFPIDLAAWIRSMQTIDYYPNFLITNEMLLWEAYRLMFISPELFNEVFNDEHTAGFVLVSVHETIGIESCQEFAEKFSDWCEAEGIYNSYDQGGVVTAAQAMYALWDALEIAGEPDPDKINDALRALRIDVDDSHFVYPALAPALEWESNGNCKYTTQFACQLQDGEKVILWPEEYKQADPRW
ncbi:ABC transporter substrate-binding protein, partial [Chloroflexota bacterium]